MAVSYSYMRDIMLGGVRQMTGDIYPNYTIQPNYVLTGGLNNGLLGPMPFSQDAQILSEIAHLRQILMQAIQLAAHPPLMITSSERMAPLMVTDDAIKAIAAGKLETPMPIEIERVGSCVNDINNAPAANNVAVGFDAGDGVALMSTAHPVERLEWEKDGPQARDLWPDFFGDLGEYAEKAEAAIEAEFAEMKKNGDEMARAVSFLGHATDGMPPRFIPQLD